MQIFDLLDVWLLKGRCLGLLVGNCFLAHEWKERGRGHHYLKSPSAMGTVSRMSESVACYLRMNLHWIFLLKTDIKLSLYQIIMEF